MTAILKKAVLLAKIVTSDVPHVTRVSVGKYVMDEKLTMYFKEQTQYYVKNPLKQWKEGDYVLIRELSTPETKNVTHVIEKLIYERGNYIDPLTGKKCAGVEFIDDIKRTSELFGMIPPFLKKKS